MAFRVRCQTGRVLNLLLVGAACGSTGGTGGACQEIGDMGMVRGAEYRPCAAEIVAVLDSLRSHLEDYMAGEDAARARARKSYRRMRDLLGQTGIERDFRSIEPGGVIVRWPDSETRAFNSAALKASVMYTAALAPSRAEDVGPGTQDNFQQGVKSHDEARRYFRQIR